MNAEELMIGYSLSKNVSPNIDADEDVFSEAAGTRPRKPLRRNTPMRATQPSGGGLFRKGGATDLATKLGGGLKSIVQGAQKNRSIKQKAKLAESAGLAKAAQMASMPSNEPIKKDNTMKYVLIGVGGLAVLGLAFYMIKKGKK